MLWAERGRLAHKRASSVGTGFLPVQWAKPFHGQIENLSPQKSRWRRRPGVLPKRLLWLDDRVALRASISVGVLGALVNESGNCHLAEINALSATRFWFNG